MTSQAHEASRPIFYILPFEEINKLPQDHPLIVTLWLLINKGYQRAGLQYQIITSLRIRKSIIDDLQLKPGSFLGCLLVPPSEETAHRTKLPKLVESVSAIGDWDLPGKFPYALSDINLEIVKDISTFQFDTQRLVGTAGLKPVKVPEALELTCFCSFQKGVGKTLVELMKWMCKSGYYVQNLSKMDRVTKLQLTAIEEHDLVAYYEKVGFTFLESVYVPLVEGMAGGGGGKDNLESGIAATKAFHVALMEQNL